MAPVGMKVNTVGVSSAVRVNRRCLCARGLEGAIAVGIATERSGVRKHAVGMDAEAPR
jgi:hypothetical protein